MSSWVAQLLVGFWWVNISLKLQHPNPPLSIYEDIVLGQELKCDGLNLYMLGSCICLTSLLGYSTLGLVWLVCLVSCLLVHYVSNIWCQKWDGLDWKMFAYNIKSNVTSVMWYWGTKVWLQLSRFAWSLAVTSKVGTFSIVEHFLSTVCSYSELKVLSISEVSRRKHGCSRGWSVW